MSTPIVGTWDGFEDAAEALQKSGVSFILIGAMEGSRICRVRTNAETVESLDWMTENGMRNIETLRKGFEE